MALQRLGIAGRLDGRKLDYAIYQGLKCAFGGPER
jgi:hypothetical protein